jgi:hypothetical protein
VPKFLGINNNHQAGYTPLVLYHSFSLILLFVHWRLRGGIRIVCIVQVNVLVLLVHIMVYYNIFLSAQLYIN